MSRNVLNLIVDVLTFVGVMVLVLSGLLMKLVLPAGSPRMGLALFGWTRHEWADFHFWATVGVGVILVVHLALHWRWVCTTIGRMVLGKREKAMRSWERNFVGVAWLVIIVGVTAGLLGGAKALVYRDQATIDQHRGANRATTVEEEVAMDGRGEGLRRRGGGVSR